MNCKSCQKELEAFREGSLAPGSRNMVKAHLEGCRECAWIYKLEVFADRVIDQEKDMESNPFLVTRIMAQIEDSETAGIRNSPVFRGILRPALLMISVAGALLLGVLIGNIHTPSSGGNEIPVELALMNDAVIESLDMLANE